MMKNIKKIESIENGFVEQLKQLLPDVFSGPVPLDLDTDYFLGEDDKGTRCLYFDLRNKKFGQLYNKILALESYQVPGDVEEMFMNEIVKELTLAGVAFIVIEKINQSKAMTPTIIDKRIVLRQIIHLN
jgi:hypothetical protein